MFYIFRLEFFFFIMINRIRFITNNRVNELQIKHYFINANNHLNLNFLIILHSACIFIPYLYLRHFS